MHEITARLHRAQFKPGRLQGRHRSFELSRPRGFYFILQGNVQPLAGKVHEGIIGSTDFTLTSRPLQTHFMELNFFFYTDKHH